MNTVVFETSGETTVRLPSARIQPIAAADVAAAVVEVSTGRRCKASATLPPGRPSPRRTRQGHSGSQQDNRTVMTDNGAGVFAAVTGDVRTAGPDAHLAPTHYQDGIQTVRQPGKSGSKFRG